MDLPEPDLHSEELTASWDELRAAGEEAEELVAGLTPDQLRWRPEPDRWSVAECLEHLVLTGEVYLEALDPVIEEARERGRVARGDYRPTLVGRWLTRLLEPPPGLPVPSPPVVVPGGAAQPTPEGDVSGEGEPLADFLALRGRLAERLAAADGLDLRRVRMSSPFFSLIRFDLGSAFRVIAAHERRHLWQARRVTGAEGFPAPS